MFEGESPSPNVLQQSKMNTPAYVMSLTRGCCHKWVDQNMLVTHKKVLNTETQQSIKCK